MSFPRYWWFSCTFKSCASHSIKNKRKKENVGGPPLETRIPPCQPTAPDPCRFKNRNRGRSFRTTATMTENIIQHLGYVGIVLLLVLGGLGLPVPEEAPIILAAVLSKK